MTSLSIFHCCIICFVRVRTCYTRNFDNLTVKRKSKSNLVNWVLFSNRLIVAWRIQSKKQIHRHPQIDCSKWLPYWSRKNSEFLLQTILRCKLLKLNEFTVIDKEDSQSNRQTNVNWKSWNLIREDSLARVVHYNWIIIDCSDFHLPEHSLKSGAASIAQHSVVNEVKAENYQIVW